MGTANDDARYVASLFGVLAFAEEGFEGVGAGEIVKQALALFGIHGSGEELGALFAELLEPGFVFGAELLLEFFAEALSERGTLAGGGDGDLERAALHHGGIVEVAKLGNVDDVAEHAATASFGGDVLLELRIRGGDDDEKHSVEVGRLERTREPFDLAGGGPKAHLPGGFRSDDADFGRGVEQAGDFALGHGARADDETGLSGELNEHGEQVRARSFLGDRLHRVILAENGKRKIENGKPGRRWHDEKIGKAETRNAKFEDRRSRALHPRFAS